MTTATLNGPILGFFDILVAPRDAFRRLNLRGAWLVPLLLVSAATILLSYGLLPVSLRLVEASAAPGTPPEQLASVLKMVELGTRIGWVATPFLLLGKWLLTALALAGGALLVDLRVRFRELFALVAQASVIVLLQQVTTFAVVYAKGDRVRTVEELTPAMGIDLLLPGLSGPGLAVAQTFSVFTVWWLAVLVLGVAHQCGCRRRRALVVVAPVALLLLALRLGALALTG